MLISPTVLVRSHPIGLALTAKGSRSRMRPSHPTEGLSPEFTSSQLWRDSSHKTGQTSLSLSLSTKFRFPLQIPNGALLPALQCICPVTLASSHFTAYALFHPSENRAIFVLTCVLSVSGGFITDSQDKDVERSSKPVAFIEHMGKAVPSATTCTEGNTLLSFG